MKTYGFKKFIVSSLFVVGSAVSTTALAQQASLPIVCPGYEPGKSELPGERTGLKIQRAFEAYSNDQIDEAIEELRSIKTKIPFDRAYTDRFLGNLLAGIDGKAAEALEVLTRAVEPGVLNDADQATTLKIVADLSLQEQKYEDAIKWYGKWIDFTCKQDSATYVRIANSYMQLKRYEEVIAPADKAIEVATAPDKNAYILKMASFYERKMYNDATSVVETIVQTFPDDKAYWVQLGFLYMLTEKYDQALSTFETSYLAGFLSKKSEIKTLSQLYAIKEIPYKAAVLQEKYIDNGLLEKDETNYSALANVWQQARNYEKAAFFYGKAAAINNDPEYYKRQGTLLLGAEKYKEAVVALTKALENGVDSVGQVQIALMEANFYQGKFKQAYAHNLEAQKDKKTRSNAKAWEAFIKDKAKNRGITI